MAPRSQTPLPKDEPNAKPLDGVAIGRLLALARPEAGRLALGMLFLLIGSVTTLFYPEGLKFVVDEVLNKKRFDLIMLAVVPPVALGAVAYGRRVRRLSRDVQDALAQASEVAEESLAGIRTVRSFAAEELEAQRYHDAVFRSFDLARRRARITATFMSVASIGAYGAIALVLWYGLKLVVSGSLSQGSLVSFVLYTMTMAFSLGSLSELWADFMR